MRIKVIVGVLPLDKYVNGRCLAKLNRNLGMQTRIHQRLLFEDP